jgi:dolichol-phosphate mannosyltransferase
MISIISPVYNSEKIIEVLVKRIADNVQLITTDFEIILVEDGSIDDSWSKIVELSLSNKRIRGAKLSRNFGQHAAITAGLKISKGDWVVVIDCDLQDRPEEIINLYNEAQKGFDVVLARRIVRYDSIIKKTTSKLFYTVFAYLTGTKQDNTVANFGIYNRKVIDAILSMKDVIRYFPTMIQWVGFKQGTLEVKHSEREEGKSSYTWRKLFKLAFDNIIAFSDKPLRLTVRLGLSISLVSFVVGLYYLLQYFKGSIEVTGYTSLIISLWFLSGLIMFILGIIGLYLGKVFDKVKDRPVYIVSDSTND